MTQDPTTTSIVHRSGREVVIPCGAILVPPIAVPVPDRHRKDGIYVLGDRGGSRVLDCRISVTPGELPVAGGNAKIFGRNPMARRSVPAPKPKSPILTVGQKRRRIERLQKCVTSLEAFDPQKARKRAPAVLELEAAIDKTLSSAFGYGTSAYLRFNQAATLDPPLGPQH